MVVVIVVVVVVVQPGHSNLTDDDIRAIVQLSKDQRIGERVSIVVVVAAVVVVVDVVLW